MALQSTTNINVDFYDNKYILINAKQYDSSSRWVSITCYNHGELFNLSASKHAAYVRYRKADGNGVLSFCRINYKGEVLVELTEQMLAADGICYVDLIIINKGSAIVNVDTCEIITIDDSPILSTMAFCVNVYESAIDNSLIESSYEYDALNELLQKAEADYNEVVLLAKSYAVGDANNIRENEDYDNAKYYCELSTVNANNAKVSEDNAKTYMEQAYDSASEAHDYMLSTEKYMNNAKISETNAKASEDNAKISETNTKASEGNAKTSEINAKASEENAKASELAAEGFEAAAHESMINAELYMNNAKTSETNAKTSETNAKSSEDNAKASETNAKVSETNAKSSEDNAMDSELAAERFEAAAHESMLNAKESETNAYEYYTVCKGIGDSLTGVLSPNGTISFNELATADKYAGCLYVISDSFVTDDTFKEGSGINHLAGTAVYYTVDGYWACFDGLIIDKATVDEVKSYLNI